MKELYSFVLALLLVGHPVLAVITVIAIALRFLPPIHFSFSLGHRFQKNDGEEEKSNND
jgi:hypothetical protein